MLNAPIYHHTRDVVVRGLGHDYWMQYFCVITRREDERGRAIVHGA